MVDRACNLPSLPQCEETVTIQTGSVSAPSMAPHLLTHCCFSKSPRNSSFKQHTFITGWQAEGED